MDLQMAITKYRRKKRFPAVKDLETYINAPHVTQHNTVTSEGLSADLAKAIYKYELERASIEITEHLPANWLRNKVVEKAIEDKEFLEKIVREDIADNVRRTALKKLRNNLNLLKEIVVGDFPDILKKYSKSRISRIKKSIRFILE